MPSARLGILEHPASAPGRRADLCCGKALAEARMPDLIRPELRARRAIECRLPIADSIKTVAARLGAKEEQAWRGIKAKCAAGLLTLEGIDEKGRPRTVERHWIVYIERW